MTRYPTRNPFQPLIARAVREAVAGIATAPATDTAPALVAVETQPELVTVDPVTGNTTYPFELNSDVLNDPNALLFAL